MNLLVNTLIITGIVSVVIFFIIAASINIAAKKDNQSKIIQNVGEQEE